MTPGAHWYTSEIQQPTVSIGFYAMVVQDAGGLNSSKKYDILRKSFEFFHDGQMARRLIMCNGFYTS